MKPYTLAVIGIRLLAVYLLVRFLIWIPAVWMDFALDSDISVWLDGSIWSRTVAGLLVTLIIISIEVVAVWYAAKPVARWMVGNMANDDELPFIPAKLLLLVLISVVGIELVVTSVPALVASFWESWQVFLPGLNDETTFSQRFVSVVAVKQAGFLGMGAALIWWAPNIVNWVMKRSRSLFEEGSSQ